MIFTSQIRNAVCTGRTNCKRRDNGVDKNLAARAKHGLSLEMRAVGVEPTYVLMHNVSVPFSQRALVLF